MLVGQQGRDEGGKGRTGGKGWRGRRATALLATKRDHGIDLRGASRRNVTRHQRDRGQNARDHRDRRRIRRPDTIQERREETACRTPHLAPAYDLIGTIPYIPGDGLALSLGNTKEFRQIDLERFRRFAEKAGLPVRVVTQTARETAAKVRDLWSTHEPLRVLPEHIREAITAHMKTVPL